MPLGICAILERFNTRLGAALGWQAAGRLHLSLFGAPGPLGPYHYHYKPGRGRGVGRALGVGVTLGAGVGVEVGVAVGVGVGVGLAVSGTIA